MEACRGGDASVSVMGLSEVAQTACRDENKTPKTSEHITDLLVIQETEKKLS